MALKHGEYRVHELHESGYGARCSEPRLEAVSADVTLVTCRRCIVMRQRGVSVLPQEVLLGLARTATERAQNYLFRGVATV